MPRTVNRNGVAAADTLFASAQAAVKDSQFEQALYSRAWLYWAKAEWRDALAGFESLIAAFPEKAQHPPIQYYIDECRKNLEEKKNGS